ncbi:MAG TPA: CHAT domain-containing protein [Candidatus Angelobacter sp.]
MRLVNPGIAIGAAFFLCVSLAVAQTRSRQPATDPELQPGVSVEKVAKGSVAEKMGLAEGDILLHWIRSDSSGAIASPLDLLETEIEQLPRSAVLLEGLRGGEKQTWKWTADVNTVVKEGDWGLTARPNFVGHLLSAHQAGVDAMGSGKAAEAAEQWRTGAEESQAQRLPPGLSAWFWLRAAGAWAAAKEWERADVACRNAVGLVSQLGSAAVSWHLRACADAFLQHQQEGRAEKYYQQALIEAQKANAKGLGTASLLSCLGRLAYGREDLAPAEDFLAQAAGIQEQVAPGSLVLALSFNRIGVYMQESGELDKSENYLERALAIRENLAADSTALAATLENLGNTFTMRGEADRAMPYLLRSLKLLEKLLPDSSRVAGCLVDMSSSARARGDLGIGEDYLRRALAIQKRLQPRGPGTAASLNNLGLLLQERGQIAEAEESFKQALAIKEELAPGSLNVAITIGNIGALLAERGDLEEAEKYLLQSLAIRQKVAPRSTHVGIAYTELGNVALQRQALVQAEDYYRKALAIQEETSPDGQEAADDFQRLGDIAIKKGNAAEAEKDYLLALNIRQRLSRSSAGSAETLMALAEVARRKQRWDVAGQRFQEALEALEGQTARLGGTEGIRASFRARYEDYYKGYIDLLIEQQKPEQALNVLERTRARMLLETLAAARVDIRAGVDRALLSQERNLQAQITAKSDRRIRLLGDKHSDEQIAALDKERKELLDQYAQAESRIRTTSPGYSALTQPQPLTTVEVQQLLDVNTLLLEYSLGEEHSYVFAVTPDSVVAHELPKQAEVDRLARSVYESLTARNRVAESESAVQKQRRWAQADKDYAVLSAQLSKMLLGPIAAEIEGKRLLVVSDGALQYIPYAALPDPEDISNTPAPLIAAHEIVNLPSASVLAILRRQEKERKPAPKSVAVLADPVFSTHDGRLAASLGLHRPEHSGAPTDGGSAPSSDLRSTSLSDEMLTRSMRDVGLDLSRLPFTRREAAAIISLVPEGQSVEALDFEATRATATSPELAQYRIVHFATHGLLDSQHPEFSGLVLSLVDQQGKPQSGFLSLEDIYNLNLPAELVVLSACETGLGKEINGEGLIGLTRGFMYAGATRVVASLWSVNDAGTAELMARFYRGVLRDKLPPASALRQAQAQMWKHPRWKSPYYWAAFQIQGDWR